MLSMWIPIDVFKKFKELSIGGRQKAELRAVPREIALKVLGMMMNEKDVTQHHHSLYIT